MNIDRLIFTLIILFLGKSVLAQSRPELNIKFSKLYATYEFIQNLSPRYPDNFYRNAFQSSEYNTDKFEALIKEFDNLNIYETYKFQGYPVDQKIPGTTTNFIKKNLIVSANLEDFKNRTFGIIPNPELLRLCKILEKIEPVYDDLVYLENREIFCKKVDQFSNYVDSTAMERYFEAGLKFYGTQWDNSIPFEIAVVPSLSKGGFAASAFVNNAVIEIPLEFKSYDILLSVLMHEIYHILYDEQSLEIKLDLKKGFQENESANSQYAFLLLNEVLATALGNGYVYEQLTGNLDEEDWYYVKYINQMSKKIYPLIENYIAENKPLDRDFVDNYISIYDRNFSEWPNELDHVLTYRYIIADDPNHFDFFLKYYPWASISYMSDELTAHGLNEMKKRPITKILLVSSEHPKKLQVIKKAFPELQSWSYDPNIDFVHVEVHEDKTKLIIVNAIHQETLPLLEKTFEKKRIDQIKKLTY